MNVKATFLSGIAILLAGCNGPAKTNSANAGTDQEPLKVTHVSFHADEKGKPGPEVKIFDYRQRLLHFRVVLNRALKGGKGRWVFSAKSTSAGGNREIQALDGEINGNEMAAQLELKNNWPVGTYHVEIIIDDTPVHGFDYEVTGEKSAIVFLGHSLAPDNGHGLPGVPVKAFKPSNKTVFLQVTTKGVDTSEPEVVWRLFHIVKGKETELANTVQPRIRLQDSVLKAQFSSPKEWQPGDYRADIFMDGKKVHSIPFKVEG